MSNEKEKRAARNKETFAVIGELVMISSNRVLITVLDLGGHPMLESVVATLDPARKVEILKARAKHIGQKDWKTGVTKFCDKVDNVFKQRNIACHTPPVLEAGIWTFKPIAAAKLFNNLDLSGKKVHPIHLDVFRTAIKTGEAALGAGVNLIENFERFNAEIRRRATAEKPHP